MPHPFHVALTLSNTLPFARRSEPVTSGIPLAHGLLREVKDLRLMDAAEQIVPCQFEVTAQWRNGSIKWLLLDFQADLPAAGNSTYQLVADAQMPVAAEENVLIATRTESEVRIQTGVADFLLRTGGAAFLELAERGETRCFRLPSGAVVERLSVESEGALRVEVRIDASWSPTAQARPLRCVLRAYFYAGKRCFRLLTTLHNPAAALHRDNFWDLGDPGSSLFEDLSLVVEHGLTPPFVCSVDGEVVGKGQWPERYLLYQDSSGGEHWNSENHLNRSGEVPMRFRGYQLYAGADTIAQGHRAEGRLVLGGPGRALGVALRHFWQNAPKSLEVSSESIRIGLFPREFADLHEMQGGEQKTHECLFALAASPEEVDRELAAMQHPLMAVAPSSHYLETGVFQEQPPGNRQPFDEYGWRHFGCVMADHEDDDRGICVGEKSFDGPISHYNNAHQEEGQSAPRERHLP